jgi:hypothetical protein
VLVDPDILRAVADQTAITSSMVNDAETGRKVATAGDGLPGSSTQWAARLLGDDVAKQAETISLSVTKLGNAVRGASNGYEVTDIELEGSLRGIF